MNLNDENFTPRAEVLEAEYKAYKNKQKRQQGEQLDIFGVAS